MCLPRAFGDFTMWLTIAAIYCLVSWLIAAVLVGLYRQTGAAVAAQTGVKLASMQWRIVLVAPLAMPIILYVLMQELVFRVKQRRHLAVLRKVMNTVREYEFAKVNSLHLAEPIQRRFERHTPAFFQLGFNLIGDYRMKPQPVEVHDRIFLSADGETLATICVLLKGGGESMITILSDGTCVHTSSSKNPKPERDVQPSDQICVTYLPDVSIEEQFREHQNKVRQECANRGVTVLEQHAEQFREVLVYDQRLFNRWRHRHGDLDKLPPAPDFRSLTGTALTTVLA